MVSQDIEIKATPKQCYQVITDFKSYPKFLKEIFAIEVKKKTGETCAVTYHIKIIKDISYTLKMKGKPHERVEWSFVEGDFMRDNHGFWQLEEIKKGVTQATYNIDIKFGLLVPSLISKKLTENHLPTLLKAFKKRIESMKV